MLTQEDNSAPPTVTIIITAFDRTDYVRQAIQSALQQSFRSFEIIVTDDSRSDAIKSVCHSFQRSEIRYRTNPETLGVALNLRAAITEARGQYIAVLNDDDAWEPQFLESLVRPLRQKRDRILSFSDHWIMSEDGQVDVQRTDANTVHYGRSLLQEGEITNLDELVLEKNAVPLAMASVFRKDAIKLELLVKDVVGAYDFWISCLLAALRRPAYYVPKRLTRYRIHKAMESGRETPEKNENMVFIYQKLIDSNYFPDKMGLLKRRYSESFYHVGRDNLFFDRVSMARQNFVKSLRVATNCRAIAGLCISYLPRPIRIASHFTSCSR